MRAVGAWRSGVLAATAVCCLVGSVDVASGLEPGVHADPGSPAAKEYALPLDQARQTGSESTSTQGTESHLFGAGIKPPGSRGSARGEGSSAHGGNGTSKAGTNGGTQSVAPTPGASATSPSQSTLTQAALRAEREPGSGSGSGSVLALVGGGVAILVLGGLGGTVLRHSRRPRPSA